MTFVASLKNISDRIRALQFGSSARTDDDRSVARRLFATFEKELELAEIHGLQFYVRGGTVTIYGTVKNSLDVDLIVSLVRQIPGVKGVKTSLQVIDPWFLGENVQPA